MGNFAQCLPITLKFEGGWADDPHDPGGCTMKGITLETFRQYHPSATVTQLRNISDSDLEEIYRDGYWNPVNGNMLASGVDLAAFDYAVNSGPEAVFKALDSTADYVPVDRVKAICARRLSILEGLKTWKYFGSGWSSRVNQVEVIGIRMASSTPEVAKSELNKAADEHTSKVKVANKSLGGVVVTSSGATVAVPHLPVMALVLIALVLAVISVIALLALSRHKSAALALTIAAKGI